MSEYAMSIDGQQVRGTAQFGVINPATEAVFARAPQCNSAQLEAAIAGAQRAFSTWKRDEAGRRNALRAAAARLQQSAPAIARTLTEEQGKPLAQASDELARAVASLNAYAAMPFPHEITQDDDKGRIEIVYRPFGVVAAITPWNFPILIAISKIAPALLAGNTIVLKPSPFTPLATLQLGTVLNEVLPSGVLNVVSGDGELGEQLTSHPEVRKISFTGSIPTGRKVASTAAQDLKRVTLELGGNDPAIVLADADVERIALRVFWSSFYNAGQVCLAVKRVYVAERLFQPLVSALSKIAQSATVGDGFDPATQIGPINNEQQLVRVCALTADAKRQGATVHTGGERLGRTGYFFPPTVLSGVDDQVPVVAQEQFGPVLPVLPFRDVDEAIERANASNYGLGASVWGSDVARATEIAKQIEAGTVWINQHVALTSKAPFGGAKWSGIGLASGRWALESYLQKHVINLARS